MNGNVWEVDPVNEQLGRERLAKLVTDERKRRFRTVTKAIVAADVSRGSWENLEAGRKVKDSTLTAVEVAFGWPIGYAQSVIDGGESDELSRALAALERLKDPDSRAEVLEAIEHFVTTEHSAATKGVKDDQQAN